MTNIAKFLNTIKNAVYGRDMRSAIHDGINSVNSDLKNHVAGTADRHKATDIDYADGVTVKEQIDSKADHQNANGGFNGGNKSNAAQGGAAVGANSYTYNGGAVGNNAKSTNGFSGGYQATTSTGSATGSSAKSDWGGAAGANAYTSKGGAIGNSAKSGDGFSGGNYAAVKNNGTDDEPNYIDAIQLGTGTNNTPKTLQVYDKRIIDADGSLTDVGNLNNLITINKTGIVQAINELAKDEKLTIQTVTVTKNPLTSDSLNNYIGSFSEVGPQTAKAGDYAVYIINYKNSYTTEQGDDYADYNVGILIASYFYDNDSNNRTEGVNQLYIEPTGKTFYRAITKVPGNYSDSGSWSEWKQMNASLSDVQSSILAYVGNKESLNTENKTTLVSAINELVDAIEMMRNYVELTDTIKCTGSERGGKYDIDFEVPQSTVNGMYGSFSLPQCSGYLSFGGSGVYNCYCKIPLTYENGVPTAGNAEFISKSRSINSYMEVEDGYILKSVYIYLATVEISFNDQIAVGDINDHMDTVIPLLTILIDNKVHVDVMYRNEDKNEPNTIYFIIDEDASDNINGVSYNNVIFAKNTPETTAAENWFETEGGEAGAADATKIVMQNGMLKVLKTPDENTDFLNE